MPFVSLIFWGWCWFAFYCVAALLGVAVIMSVTSFIGLSSGFSFVDNGVYIVGVFG